MRHDAQGTFNGLSAAKCYCHEQQSKNKQTNKNIPNNSCHSFFTIWKISPAFRQISFKTFRIPLSCQSWSLNHKVSLFPLLFFILSLSLFVSVRFLENTVNNSATLSDPERFCPNCCSPAKKLQEVALSNFNQNKLSLKFGWHYPCLANTMTAYGRLHNVLYFPSAIQLFFKHQMNIQPFKCRFPLQHPVCCLHYTLWDHFTEIHLCYIFKLQ